MARSYPTAVAGDIVDFRFNVSTGHVMLQFKPNSNASTNIYLSSEYQYFNGFNVSVVPEDCCAITNTKDGTSVVALRNLGLVEIQVHKKIG